MNWKIIWSRHSLQDMKRLDHQTASRVHQALRRLAETGHGDVRKLQDSETMWRLRVGGWRVQFVYDYEESFLRVARVLPRGGAYRD